MAMSELKRTENSVLEGKEDVRIGVPRHFTTAGSDPFDTVEMETRTALIPGKDGPSFEQRDVEFPKFWSQTATNIVAQKYFRGKLNSPEREHSVRQMIGRVADSDASVLITEESGPAKSSSHAPSTTYPHVASRSSP